MMAPGLVYTSGVVMPPPAGPYSPFLLSWDPTSDEKQKVFLWGGIDQDLLFTPDAGVADKDLTGATIIVDLRHPNGTLVMTWSTADNTVVISSPTAGVFWVDVSAAPLQAISRGRHLFTARRADAGAAARLAFGDFFLV